VFLPREDKIHIFKPPCNLLLDSQTIEKSKSVIGDRGARLMILDFIDRRKRANGEGPHPYSGPW
jgi:hypothetical protein